ncbi:MAG: hypothetical protein DDT25_00523 [Chloroflexi bacterium]|nr:hypothetical protein [Chloroflexota bacterium]
MKRVGIVNNKELQVFAEESWQGYADRLAGAVIDVPDGYPESLRWNGEDFEAIPLSLTPHEIYNLFTTAEKVLFHGSQWPQVHGLIAALMFHEGTIEIQSSFYQNGVGLLFALHGNSEFNPERVGRVLRGLPLEIAL